MPDTSLVTVSQATGEVTEATKPRKGSVKMQPLKVQRSLVTSGPEELALIYNQSRTVNLEIPLDPTLKKFMGRRLKVYVMGAFVPNPDPRLKGEVFKIDKDMGQLPW